jgi:O-antigen ligase
VLHTHSIFLQLAVETGLPFALFFLGLLGTFFFSTARRLVRKQSGLIQKDVFYQDLLIAGIVVFLMQIFDLALLMTYRLNFIFWLCLAIPYSWVSVSEPEGDHSKTKNEGKAQNLIRPGSHLHRGI